MLLRASIFDRSAGMTMTPMLAGEESGVSVGTERAVTHTEAAPREQRSWLAPMFDALRRHWPEYWMEAAGLGLFMTSACVFTVFLQYPSSPVHQAIPNEFVRGLVMGVAMGLTLVGIIYSPWGKQSGAHLNPGVTLAFFRLGKVAPWDVAFYVGAQFFGGVAGTWVAATLLGRPIVHPRVNYAATVPGPSGAGIAFLAEFVISFVLMFVVLLVANTRALNRFTGLFAGGLVWLYISFEAPLSGMSMNPARTLGSAVLAHTWTALWVYFTAPPLAMLLAAELFLRVRGARAALCAKLHHENDKRCIFRCNYMAAAEPRA